MSISKSFLLYSTFIGLTVEVVKSTNPDLMGKKGKVVDETKNLIVIRENNKDVKLPKNSCVFRFFLKDGFVDVEGWRICFRPHERPKKVRAWR